MFNKLICILCLTTFLFNDAIALMWNDTGVVPVQSISDHRWRDAKTGLFTCCNTAFNKGERQVEIGGYMFCDATNENGQPLAGVRQCLQGGQPTKLSWWDGLWQDDAWSAECDPRWCNNNEPPSTDVIPIPDPENFCYNWQPATNEDGTPISSGDPYSVLIRKLESAIKSFEKQCGTAQ